jgi:outer membrane protein TolC
MLHPGASPGSYRGIDMGRPFPKRWIIQAGAFAALAIAVAGAAGAGETVDFREAVRRAILRNPSVAVSGFELEAARRDVEIARGYNLPSLTFEEKFVRSSAPAEVFGLKMNRQKLSLDDFADPVSRFNDPAPVSDFVTSLTLEQPLFAPKAVLGYRMAQREVGAREKDSVRSREEAVRRVILAWLGVRTAREYVAVTAEALHAAKLHLELAGKVERAGVGLASDGLRARVAVAEAESASVSAKNRLELARRGLALAIGEVGGASVDPQGELPPFPPCGTIEERIAKARTARSDLDAVADRVRNADAAVDFQRAESLPTVGLRAGYQLDGGSPFNPDNRSWNVGLGLRWNLFDGMRKEASTARARVERGRAKEQLRGMGDLAAYQVSEAWLAVADAGARVAIARESVGAAEEGVRLIGARYENQLGKMIDLLDAQAALDGARAGLVRAGNDYVTAQAELEFATGTLLPWATQGIRFDDRGGRK